MLYKNPLMPTPISLNVPPSYFHYQQSNLFPKFFDGSFNSNKTNFGGKSLCLPLSLSMTKPVQPAAKLLDGWFNGNTTNIRPKANNPTMVPM